jgi:hypothetical protein
MTRVVNHLPSKHEALNSNTNSILPKKKGKWDFNFQLLYCACAGLTRILPSFPQNLVVVAALQDRNGFVFYCS